MNYPVNEMFYTLQGEGVHMGRAAFFIRLHGCPVHCPWCDSASTWHPNYTPKDIPRYTAEELALEVVKQKAELVVITGGEPTVYPLTELVGAIHNAGAKCHLETSGTFPLTGMFEWITLSPKKWKEPLMDSVVCADEFKIIVEEPEDVHFYHGMLLRLGLETDDRRSVWLHPEWSKREDPQVLQAIIQAVKYGVGTFRAGWQLHKLYKVDSLDERSRKPVPLGGNPSKGL